MNKQERAAAVANYNAKVRAQKAQAKPELPADALRIERLQRALQLAITALNEAADALPISQSAKARELNNIAAHCRQQMHA